MGEEWVTTKEILLEHIERDWQAINHLLDSLSVAQWIDLCNVDGWTVKDHVAHLVAWEDSVIGLLSRQPRHKRFGISESLYLSGDVDAINHALFEMHRDDDLEAVRNRFQSTHAILLSQIEALDDEALNLPYAHYLPDEPGEDEGPPVINIIYGNTAHHFREHQAWIQSMLENAT